VVLLLSVGLSSSDKLSIDVKPVELEAVILEGIQGLSGTGVTGEVEEASSLDTDFGLGEPSLLEGFIVGKDLVDLFTFNELDSLDSANAGEEVLDGVDVVVAGDVEQDKGFVQVVTSWDQLFLEVRQEVVELNLL